MKIINMILKKYYKKQLFKVKLKFNEYNSLLKEEKDLASIHIEIVKNSSSDPDSGNVWRHMYAANELKKAAKHEKNATEYQIYVDYFGELISEYEKKLQELGG